MKTISNEFNYLYRCFTDEAYLIDFEGQDLYLIEAAGRDNLFNNTLMGHFLGTTLNTVKSWHKDGVSEKSMAGGRTHIAELIHMPPIFIPQLKKQIIESSLDAKKAASECMQSTVIENKLLLKNNYLYLLGRDLPRRWLKKMFISCLGGGEQEWDNLNDYSLKSGVLSFESRETNTFYLNEVWKKVFAYASKSSGLMSFVKFSQEVSNYSSIIKSVNKVLEVPVGTNEYLQSGGYRELLKIRDHIEAHDIPLKRTTSESTKEIFSNLSLFAHTIDLQLKIWWEENFQQLSGNEVESPSWQYEVLREFRTIFYFIDTTKQSFAVTRNMLGELIRPGFFEGFYNSADRLESDSETWKKHGGDILVFLLAHCLGLKGAFIHGPSSEGKVRADSRLFKNAVMVPAALNINEAQIRLVLFQSLLVFGVISPPDFTGQEYKSTGMRVYLGINTLNDLEKAYKAKYHDDFNCNKYIERLVLDEIERLKSLTNDTA